MFAVHKPGSKTQSIYNIKKHIARDHQWILYKNRRTCKFNFDHLEIQKNTFLTYGEPCELQKFLVLVKIQEWQFYPRWSQWPLLM